MKKLDKYILKNYVKSIFISLIAFLLISIITQINRAIGYVLDDKMSAIIATKWLFSEVPKITVMLAPLSVLLGGLLTINKMSKNLEIIALKTSGISFFRITIYPLIFSFLMSLGMIYFNDKLTTKNNKLKREIKYKYLYDLTPGKITSSIYRKGIENYLYYIRIVNGDKNVIQDLTVVVMAKNFESIEYIYTISKAEYNEETKKWKGRDVWINGIKSNQEKHYKVFDLIFFKETFEELLKDKFFQDEANIKDLKETISYIKNSGGDVTKLLVEYHERWAYPFSIIIMSILGLSLGSKYVRGASSMSIAISIVLGYAYYVTQSIFQAVSLGGSITPFFGAWLPNIIYLIGGIVTMRRAEY